MDDELSLIDANIPSIASLALPRTLKSLNLHSNEITKIDGLAHLSILQHLDLSANRINQIDNLGALAVLRTLNLACNNIRRIENLRKLGHLRYLNVSYNALTSLNGIEQIGCEKAVGGSQLEVLEVHGNQLRNFDDVITVLKRLPNLRHVTFRLDEMGSANPFCDAVSNYRAMLFSALPNLISVDCVTRNGMSIDRASFLQLDSVEDATDFDRELSDAESEQPQVATPSVASLFVPMQTPHIDAVLERMKQRVAKANTKTKTKPKSESGSDSDAEPPAARKSESPRRKQRSRSSSRERQAAASAKHVEKKRNTPKKRPEAREKRQKEELVMGYPFGPVSSGSSLSNGATQKARAELRTTFERVLNELTVERDRRAKIERILRRLVEELLATRENKPQEEAEKRDAEDDVIEAHRALLNLRNLAEDRRVQLEARLLECDALKDSVCKRENAAEEMRSNCVQLRQELALQETSFTKQLSGETRRANEAHARAQALSRETESLRAQLDTATKEAGDLRALMMRREAEFEQSMARRVEPCSLEFEKLVEARERAVSERYQRECDSLHEKLTLSARRYVELEDEFREALRIEEARLAELQDSYAAVCKQLHETTTELRSVKELESRHAETIAELSTFAKEARVRLEEASKSKLELVRDYRERNETLEAHLQEATKRVAVLEALRTENASLRSRLLAAESVADGLRNERKAWSNELARQGASLAQDRGTLEAQNLALAKQLAAESDSVKIKSKIIEDQTDTIQKLKAGLSEKDAEIRRIQREAIAVQKEAEQRASLAEERYEAVMQETAALRARKQELKERCSELSNELTAQQDKHEEFVARWKNKSSELASLESRVEQLTHEHSERLEKVETERDDALARLRALDDAFRKQLDAKEAFLRDQMEQLRREREQTVAAADERVARAEAEMRELLVETERTKRAMEAKLARLQSAVGDLFDLGLPGFPQRDG